MSKVLGKSAAVDGGSRKHESRFPVFSYRLFDRKAMTVVP